MTAIDTELRAAIKAAVKDTFTAYTPAEVDHPKYADPKGKTPLDRLAERIIYIGRCHPGDTL